MEKINLPKSYKAYLPMAVLFVLLVLIMPRSTKFNYDYKKGSIWRYDDLIAQFDFPILKSEQELITERRVAQESMIPYYKFDARVATNSIKSLGDKPEMEFNLEISEVLNRIYDKGVCSDREYFANQENNDYDKERVYIQKNKRAVLLPSEEIYSTKTAKLELLNSLGNTSQIDSLLAANGVYELIVPNLSFDLQASKLIHSENVIEVSPTKGVVSAGQVIVSNGEIVTAEIEQILDSYKKEMQNSIEGGNLSNSLSFWLGNSLLSLAMILVLFLVIFLTNIRIFDSLNKYLYLLFVFALCSLTTCIVQSFDSRYLFLVPYPLFAYYLLAFFNRRVILPVYFLSLLPLLIFGDNGVELFVMHLVAGIVAMYIFNIFNKSWLQFVTALIVFVCLTVVMIAFWMIDSIDFIWRNLLFVFFGSIISVAAYPLIYLFEKIFNLVSSSRLIELADTNNKILRELADKAPGTFQHSLQVMNLADAAARSIDADVALIRAGALYHDLGKLSNPQCFIENEMYGDTYHTELDFKESAQDIIKHVTDGLAIAEKAGLPQVIRDFIATHHGMTQVSFFYNKFLNDGGSSDEVDAFTYPGPKPTTKEQVILMLSDTLEAASRSLKDHSPKSISDLVDRILSSKLADGQFLGAEISLRELNIVSDSMKGYLSQIYHSRIEYPKRKLRRKSSQQKEQ